MKIKRMIVVLFFMMSVIPLIVLGCVNGFLYGQKLHRIVENDLQVATSTQVKAIENFYEERAADARVLCSSTLLNQFLMKGHSEDGQSREAARELLRSRVASNGFIERITLLNGQFQTALDSGDGAPGGNSVLSQLDRNDWGKELRFTGVIQSQRQDGPGRIIAAVQSIYNGDDLLGYLVMELNFQFFEEVRASASLFNNGTIYLLDGEHQLIAAGDSASPRQEFVLTPEEREDYRKAWAAQEPGSERGILTYRVNGERYISCYARLRHMDWLMISSINADAVIQARQGFWGICALIGLELPILLFATHKIVSICIGKPVYQMLERFKQIRMTQDYRIRMEEKEDSEIGVISKEINLLLANVEDHIRQEKQRQKSLLDRAERDSLTGLYHQSAFAERLPQRLKSAADQGLTALCVYLDVDDFKEFNTRFGHDGGDRVLQFIAQRLAAVSDGFTSRQGGDEFVACLTGESLPELERALSGLLESINRGLALREGEERTRIRCSIGGALSKEGLSGEELVKLADEAMYQVKFHQKNGVLIWGAESNHGKRGSP